jgi:hypothetical protein
VYYIPWIHSWLEMSVGCGISHKKLWTYTYSTTEAFTNTHTHKERERELKRIHVRYSNASNRFSHIHHYWPFSLFIQSCVEEIVWPNLVLSWFFSLYLIIAQHADPFKSVGVTLIVQNFNKVYFYYFSSNALCSIVTQSRISFILLSINPNKQGTSYFV